MKISYAPMSRNYSIDAIKIVAMLGVIMLHTSHDLMSESGYDLASFMYKSAVASIPLFFMVSGYLLLGRQDIRLWLYTKKNYKNTSLYGSDNIGILANSRTNQR
ncbi:MAG: acyltransferase family protein [Bacteroidales bacterium]|nr:acyltransferase family protein [Bacteroidales bacterium]